MSDILLQQFRNQVRLANLSCLAVYRQAMKLYPIQRHGYWTGRSAPLTPSRTPYDVATRRTCQAQMRVFLRLDKALLVYLQLANRPAARARWAEQLRSAVAVVFRLCRDEGLRPEYQGLEIPLCLQAQIPADVWQPFEQKAIEARGLTSQTCPLSVLASILAEARLAERRLRGEREVQLARALAAELSPDTLVLFKAVLADGGKAHRLLVRVDSIKELAGRGVQP